MPRCIQQVDQLSTIGKLHHRRGDGNTPFFFHLHPVRLGVLSGFFALDGSRLLQGLAEQQHLLCDGGLTGIRVRDDRKGAALGHFLGKVRHKLW